MEPPKIDNSAICISNDPVLSAVISCYFNKADTYFALFRFPEVKAPHNDASQQGRDDFLSNLLGNEVSIQINNAAARLKPKIFIVAGLTDLQRTYLYWIPKGRQLELDSLKEVDSKLACFKSQFSGILLCRKEDVICALLEAKRTNKKLEIREDVVKFIPNYQRDNRQGGIVVTEYQGDMPSVVAVNYAFSVRSAVAFVKHIERSEIHAVQKNISNWKEHGSEEDRAKLQDKINDRIGQLDFSEASFATFFTEGLPYSLYLENRLPISYVSTSLRPDLFVVNNILYQDIEPFESALVFSPEEFEDEETTGLIEKLSTKGFLIKPLIYRDATVTNFANYTEYYPYDILHICSHGGEVDGYYVTERFTDRAGIDHTVEYEEVVGFAPVPGAELVKVDRKAIFRKLDGVAWLSPELEAKNLPDYVFEDMQRCVCSGSLGKNAARTRITEPIATSCHVKCFDSIHQGNFRALASHSSPIVFNNTCSSWYDISSFFLAGGCRGYIGTLWSIDNGIAKTAAEYFYERLVLSGSIGESFFGMLQSIRDTRDSDIYLYWGLPFSTIKQPTGKGKVNVLKELLRAFFRWAEKAASTKIDEVRNNCVNILQFIHFELMSTFGREDLVGLERQIRRDEKLRGMLSRRAEPAEAFKRGVLHLPSEIRPQDK